MQHKLLMPRVSYGQKIVFALITKQEKKSLFLRAPRRGKSRHSSRAGRKLFSVSFSKAFSFCFSCLVLTSCCSSCLFSDEVIKSYLSVSASERGKLQPKRFNAVFTQCRPYRERDNQLPDNSSLINIALEMILLLKPFVCSRFEVYFCAIKEDEDFFISLDAFSSFILRLRA